MTTQSKYRTDFPARVRQLIATGCKDDKTIAKALGVSASTMWAWTRKHSEFADAMASVYQNPPKRDVKAAERENQVRDLLARLRSYRRPPASKPARISTQIVAQRAQLDTPEVGRGQSTQTVSTEHET